MKTIVVTSATLNEILCGIINLDGDFSVPVQNMDKLSTHFITGNPMLIKITDDKANLSNAIAQQQAQSYLAQQQSLANNAYQQAYNSSGNMGLYGAALQNAQMSSSSTIGGSLKAIVRPVDKFGLIFNEDNDAVEFRLKYSEIIDTQDK